MISAKFLTQCFKSTSRLSPARLYHTAWGRICKLYVYAIQIAHFRRLRTTSTFTRAAPVTNQPAVTAVTLYQKGWTDLV